MSVLVFDLETDGLMPAVSKIHCVAIAIDDSDPTLFDTPDKIKLALQLIQDHEGVIVGHNILSYDLPVLRKLYPGFTYKGTARDTKLLSTLIWPHIRDLDFRLSEKDPAFPKNMIGQHKLKAWGYRLGILKGDLGETNDWQKYSPEMGIYCQQDVRVTQALWAKIQSKGFAEKAIELEHQFQEVALLIEGSGFPFNKAKAVELYTTLCKRRHGLEQELTKAFPPWEVRTPFTPKVNNKARGYVKDQPTEKVVLVEFNPASRDHIADRLIAKYSWKPLAFTKGGKPQIDETVLEGLVYPEATLLTEYLMLEKRIGQLADGKNGWLKLERDGVIYGRINTCGAISGRCSHVSPNMAQVPSVDSPYGPECRELFTAPKGWVLCGADASGIQLRALSHYLTMYDGGAYRDIVLNGDVHSHNQKAFGLDTRARAKTAIYALLMGCGPEKLGQIAGTNRKDGQRKMAQFEAAIPALAQFRRDIEKRAKERGYLIGLDGRHINVRQIHAALSFLMQGFEAVVMKWAGIRTCQMMAANGYSYGIDWRIHAYVHDEYQCGARDEETANVLGKTIVTSIQEAGVHFNSNCPLTGEYRIGNDWKETH